jgi:hypothetical protein
MSRVLGPRIAGLEQDSIGDWQCILVTPVSAELEHLAVPGQLHPLGCEQLLSKFPQVQMAVQADGSEEAAKASLLQPRHVQSLLRQLDVYRAGS